VWTVYGITVSHIAQTTWERHGVGEEMDKVKVLELLLQAKNEAIRLWNRRLMKIINQIAKEVQR